MLSTPLPIFFSKDLAVPINFVFAILVPNSSSGIGYLLALNKPYLQAEKPFRQDLSSEAYLCLP